jgi:hypothetical protein
MPSKVSKPSGGVKGGAIKTSAREISHASPARPTNQGGQLVGGYPATFGVGSSRGKTGRPHKIKRAKKY